MYNVYNADNEKVFGCSSLSILTEYMKDVGVIDVVTKSKNPGGREVQINLATGEYISVSFGNNTAADVWIQVWVPGIPKEIISKKDKCIYVYRKEPK